MVYCLVFAKRKISMSHGETCSAIPNKQTGTRRFFHPEDERVPYLGYFAAADGAVSSARVGAWVIQDRATVVVVEEAMKGLLTWYQKVHVPARKHVSWHLLWPGVSVDPTLLCLALS